LSPAIRPVSEVYGISQGITSTAKGSETAHTDIERFGWQRVEANESSKSRRGR
jgi:hypothetical protein